MKPIPSNMSKETLDLLNKAQNMIKRIDVIEKEKTCDKCKGKCTCKDCPECGLSKMGCMAKGGCTTEVEKAQPGFETTFNTNPEGIGFVSETAGQTRNAYYSTNQHKLDSENVTNKGATSASVNLDSFNMNPHSTTGVNRLDDGGSKANNYSP